jgi:HAD superfamily hydrolase (TIGR01549 family)
VTKRALRGIIFDLDGTLIDSQYDWNLIRRRIGVEDLPILSHINSLKGALKEQAMRILESFEKIATKRARLIQGMDRILATITKKGIKKAIVTNNSRKTVEYLIRKFNLSFDHIVTRDDGVWKPSGAPLERAVETLRLQKEEVIYVGNSEHDRIAAEDAGIDFISINGPGGIGKIMAMLEKQP